MEQLELDYWRTMLGAIEERVERLSAGTLMLGGERISLAPPAEILTRLRNRIALLEETVKMRGVGW